MSKLLSIFLGTGVLLGQGHAQVPSPSPDIGNRLIREPNGGEDIGQDSPDRRVMDIAKRMQFVHSQLQKNQITASTREAQRQITKELQVLLDSPAGQPPPGGASSSVQSQRERQQQQDNATPNAPHGNPQISSGVGPSQQRASLIEQAWGSLPPRMRDELRAVRADEFLPKYELLIEQYFRRLAEQRSK